MRLSRLAPLAVVALSACDLSMFLSGAARVDAGTTAQVDVEASFEVGTGSGTTSSAHALACVALPEGWPAPTAVTYSGVGLSGSGSPSAVASARATAESPVPGFTWHCFESPKHSLDDGKYTGTARFTLPVPAGSHGLVRLPVSSGHRDPSTGTIKPLDSRATYRLRVGVAPADTFERWSRLYPPSHLASDFTYKRLVVGDGRVVATNNVGLIHSPDGSTWHASADWDTLLIHPRPALAHGAGTWVALDDTGRVFKLSFAPDGALSTLHCHSFGVSMSDLAYAHGRFVAAGRKLAVSENGCTWTELDTSGVQTAHVAADDAGFLAFGFGTLLRIGLDGTVTSLPWNQSELGVRVDRAAYGNGRWLAVLPGGVSRLVQSTDGGRTWTPVRSWERRSGGGFMPSTLAFIDGRFVVSSADTTLELVTGSGASGWSALDTGLSSPLISLAQNGERVFGLSEDGIVLAANRLEPEAPHVVAATLAPATRGIEYTAPLHVERGAGLVTLSIAAGALPAGMSLSQDLLTGTPTEAGRFPLTVRATDERSRTHERALELEVAEAPSFAAGHLGDMPVEQLFQRRLTVQGGVAPLSVRIDDDRTLPVFDAGAWADGHEVTFQAIPANAGPLKLTLTVTDANGAVAKGDFTATVVDDALRMDAEGDTLIARGRAFERRYVATADFAPIYWAIDGSLPDGLSWQAEEGVLVVSGTTTAADAEARWQVWATDSRARRITLPEVLPLVDPPSLTHEPLPLAARGEPYAVTIAVAGDGPFTWTTEGALPAGLTWTEVDGGLQLSGAPTETGAFSQTVRVTGGHGHETELELSFAVGERPVPQQPQPVPLAVTGREYALELVATGGKAPLAYAATDALPQGLTLTQDGEKALIGGIPTQAGVLVLTGITVTDADGLTAAFDAIEVEVVDPPQIEAPMPMAVEGEAYEAIVSATSGLAPYRWVYGDSETPWMTLKELPDGTLKLSGTPTEPGTPAFGAVTVIDANDVATTATLTVTVIAALQVTTDALAQAVEGREYRAELGAAGGLEPYTWRYDGELPAGLTFSANGDVFVLSGTPAAAGSYTLADVTVSDLSGQTARVTLELAVAEAPKEPETPEEPEQPGKPTEPGKGGCGGCDAAGASGLVALMGLAALRRRRA